LYRETTASRDGLSERVAVRARGIRPADEADLLFQRGHRLIRVVALLEGVDEKIEERHGQVLASCLPE
jgi:hypothetical protein